MDLKSLTLLVVKYHIYTKYLDYIMLLYFSVLALATLNVWTSKSFTVLVVTIDNQTEYLDF